MKKDLFIFIALLLVVAVLATLYFTMISPYNKVITHLKNRNWDAAIGLCRSKLMNKPNNHRYMGLQLYASIRKNCDEDLEDVIRENEDESNLREINSMLYKQHNLPEILVALLATEHYQYIIDNKLHTKDNNLKDKVKDILRGVNEMFSTNFKNVNDMAKAAKYMSNIGMNKLNLNNEDIVDNYYHNCFLITQSALDNSKADELIMKKYNVDSSIAELFPYCGAGLQKPLKELLQTKPDLAELQGAIDYLAIMKAADMINEINKKSPKISDLYSFFFGDTGTEDEQTAKYVVLNAWGESHGRDVDALINTHYLNQFKTALKSNKMFGMTLSIQQTEGDVEPILLSIMTYDTKDKEFSLWPFVYNDGEFSSLAIEKQNNPIVSNTLFTIFNLADDGDMQTFCLGGIESSREEYYEVEERYNPYMNMYYDYWYGGYQYYGGYETVNVSKFRNIPMLKEGAKYHLKDTNAAFIEKIENSNFYDLYHSPEYEDRESWADENQM